MSEHKPLITFEPVPVRRRHDGWTAERQIAFVEKLADTNSITAACKHVGMSRESVRKLRRHPAGRPFRDACDAALDCGYAEVEEAAAERSRNGVSRRIFYKGEQVGEWRHHDERLTMFLLRFRRPHRFGQDMDRPARAVHNSGVREARVASAGLTSSWTSRSCSSSTCSRWSWRWSSISSMRWSFRTWSAWHSPSGAHNRQRK